MRSNFGRIDSRAGWLLALAVALVLLAAGCGALAGGEPVVSITTDRANDTATVSFEGRPTLQGDRLLIDVTSASGIGGFTATLADGRWPETVTVRLHTRGLEQLVIRYGRFDITTGRSSNDSPDPALMLYVEDEQGEVQSASPSSNVYYPDIRLVNPQSEQPKLPAEDGYYEITLPLHFHQLDHDSFAMQWIDFYR